MSQLEGSLALGRAPASNGSPGAARARWAVGLLIVLALLAIALPADATQPGQAAAAERRAADAYASLPLAFVPNAGQTDERVRYYAQGAGYGLYFTDQEAVLALEKGERGHALELRFLGANPRAELEAADRATGRVNYLTGSEHQTDLPTYGRVVYREPLARHRHDLPGRGRKAALRVSPPPGRRGLRHPPRLRRRRGRLACQEWGALDRHAARRPARRAPAELPEHRRPPGPGREPLCARRRLLRVFGRTTRPTPATGDRSQPRLLHVPGRDIVDDGRGIAVDSAGAAYVTGFTFSTDFPTTAGAFDPSANDGDAFITKLNPAGSGLAYSTYLGGSSIDNGIGIAVDSAGAAYVIGSTGSTNFPTTAGAFDTSASGGDAFVTKLNPAGSGLAYSTYLGGSSSDEGRGIAVDSAGAAYVVGSTFSTGFPTTAGAFDTSANGLNDAFVTKLNPARLGPRILHLSGRHLLRRRPRGLGRLSGRRVRHRVRGLHGLSHHRGGL